MASGAPTGEDLLAARGDLGGRAAPASTGTRIRRRARAADRSRWSRGSPSASPPKRKGSPLRARRIEIAEHDDEFEFMFDQGLTDGLPVVPPTPERVIRMLAGTRRDAQEFVAVVPPNMAPATVEKIAINAVMAGCKPGVPAGGHRGGRGRLHGRVQRSRRHGHDDGRDAGGGGERPDPEPHRHEHGPRTRWGRAIARTRRSGAR